MYCLTILFRYLQERLISQRENIQQFDQLRAQNEQLRSEIDVSAVAYCDSEHFTEQIHANHVVFYVKKILGTYCGLAMFSIYAIFNGVPKSQLSLERRHDERNGVSNHRSLDG